MGSSCKKKNIKINAHSKKNKSILLNQINNHKFEIIKFNQLKKNNFIIDLNNITDDIEYIKKINWDDYNSIKIPYSYKIFNIYQLIDNNYQRKLKFYCYIDDLTTINIVQITNSIIKLRLKYFCQSYNLNICDVFIKKINIQDLFDIETVDIVINYLINEYSILECLILDHDLSVVYFIFGKHSTDHSKLEKEMIEKILFNKINELMRSVNNVFNSYQKNNMLIKSRYFYQIVEHLIANNSFSYLKKYNIPINDKYINKFGEMREFIISNNKYIAPYFSKLENGNQDKLMISNVGLYSISKPYATSLIIKYLREKAEIKFGKDLSDLVITDATAGVGGDTIAFGNEFKLVNSVEIIDLHCNIIKNNIDCFELNNVNVINQDYTKIYDSLSQDIIFIDSPWGGCQYKNNTQTDLMLFGSDLSFNCFVKNILKNKDNIILAIKCPYNFDVSIFKETICDGGGFSKMDIDKISNFNLITFY